MQRDWESFFKDIFGRYPLVAICMIVGVAGGLGLGLSLTSGASLAERMMVPIFVRYFMLTFAVVGGFGGLIVGVILDSVVGAIRGPEKKSKKRRPRSRV